MTEQSLFQKNLVFLQSSVPSLASLARRSTDTITKPVLDESGQAVDIDLGGGRLYNRPALEFAREQVTSWRNAPMRVVVNRPDPDTLEDESTKGLTRRFESEVGDTILPLPPEEVSGMLVVVGLGLGLQVPELLKQLSPRHVVLIEPIEEFAVHSLHALDWPGLSAQCQEKGATLDVVLQTTPRAVQTELEELMTQFGASAIDGAYTFVHYQTDVTKAIARGVQELAGMKSIMQGYYADEKLMIENAVANVEADEFWLLDGNYHVPHSFPAFVIGSGPSLDQSLDAIRAWQDHAIIFCAGSALQTLLGAGIRPDFQVEKENNDTTAARISHIFERVGGSGPTFGVDLIASTTVKPSITELFDTKLLFHREHLSSTRIFGEDYNPVVGTGPFSANTAMSVATTLGFRNVYLFGVDCGSVDQERHHAENTVYHTREGHIQGHNKMPIPVPGNFGGQAWTNSYFLWSRWVFETIISAAEVATFNCSDGIAIEGALPVRPEDLSIPRDKLDKADVLDAIKGASDHFEPGAYLDTQDVAGAFEAWQAFAGEVRQFLDTVLNTEDQLLRFEEKLATFLEGCDRQYGGVVVPLRGSAQSMVPVAGYYLNRAPDRETQARMMDIFREVFRERIEFILDDATDVLGTIVTNHAGVTELKAAG